MEEQHNVQISDDQLKERLLSIVSEANLETVTAKHVRLQLEQEFQLDLSARRDELGEWMREAVQKRLGNEQDDDEDEVEDVNDQNDADARLAQLLQQAESGRPRRSSTITKKKKRKAESSSLKKLSSNANSGYMAPLTMTEELQELMNHPSSLAPDDAQTIVTLPRPHVVKRMWRYIKAHNLQDPNNKQNIICDPLMERAFHVKHMTMFQMNKHLAKLLKPSEHVVKQERRVEDEEEDVDEKPVKKQRKAKSSAGGYNAALILPESLQIVMNHPSARELEDSEPITSLPRPQIVKRLWKYIKAHNLQDPSDRRQIKCDELLQKVFQKKSVHMFTMNKILANVIKNEDDVVSAEEDVSEEED